MSIVEFLLSRIQEDEAAALWAAHGPWGADGSRITDASGSQLVDAYDDYGIADDTAAHIIRWDPTRVRAECEAKRRVVEAMQAYEPSDEWGMEPDMGKRLNNAAGTLRVMAAVYSDHPDFDPIWSPDA